MDLDRLECLLEGFWVSHKDYLRRILISLTRDIDLADDLLQETYLCARAGISGYHGGSEQGWLVAIAKNVFYQHCREQTRRTRLLTDTPIDIDNCTDNGPRPGSSDHLAAIELRKAISDLSPELKTALIMRHYGGFSCKEIAEKLGWPTGTARQRVWTAMQRLKCILATIPEDIEELECSQVQGYNMLDYIYEVLSRDKLASIQAHIDLCPSCKREMRELSRVRSMLDKLDATFKNIDIVELNPDGTKDGMYSLTSVINASNEVETAAFIRMPVGIPLRFIITQGEQVDFDIVPDERDPERMERYVFDLPRPLQSNEQFETMCYGGTNRGADYLGDGRWQMQWNTKKAVLSLAAPVIICVKVLRLPEHAQLMAVDPQPSEIRKNKKTTTLIWRTIPEQAGEHACTVEYELHKRK